jgi:hypothetical protein
LIEVACFLLALNEVAGHTKHQGNNVEQRCHIIPVSSEFDKQLLPFVSA